IVDKTKGKARKRVKLPQKIQDYMVNLTIDLKEAQINLGQLETVKMNLWQSFDSLKQIVRILREKKLLGKYEDWCDLMCEDCKYKKKLIQNVIKLELEGTVKGEGDEKEIVFGYNDWELFLDRVNEKPPKPKKEEKPGKQKKKKKRRVRCKVCNELVDHIRNHKCKAVKQ
ncbi:hypothetical protein LCGC14_1419620, partial [marine sediment metagenome]